MEGVRVEARNGIRVHYRDREVALDPSQPARADFVFISHAHSDHMHSPAAGAKVLASRETVTLARARGIRLEASEEMGDIKLVDTGHILGSRGLLLGSEVYYTADVAGRPRAFLGRGRPVKCRVLILEATYGSPEYRFPPIATILKEANHIIAGHFGKGEPVVLMGHPLGKAQVLTYLFSAWEPLYLDSSVLKMNRAYRDLGVDLPDTTTTLDEAHHRGLLAKRPWVAVAPLRSGRNPLLRLLKARYGAVFIAFTGWALLPWYRKAMSVDYALPLSDHCDFQELLDFAAKCEPELVYTFHGYNETLADALKRQGFTAKPVPGFQSNLEEYMRED